MLKSLPKYLILILLVLTAGNVYFVDKTKGQELLKKGSEGGEVYETQSHLYQMGYLRVEPTGYYGDLTDYAITQFQLETGLLADGVAGPATLAKLNEIHMMAKVVYGESRGESFEGQVAVASVILNRVESNEFPNSVSEVIFQKNAFTAINDGQYYLTPNKTAYRAAIEAIKDWDPSRGATYYYNPDLVTDKWIFSRQPLLTINGHVFAN
ncbi:cell wall hydrolase [Metabacillus arenae]|uniref:Cell wall hydrolase n=1 Tax=Metabacillus arenae TaxID=2771434 RepID=A0A926S2R2_9BACI|nr:cell wall hydrolase [Metabacillus arenae]MBD1382249.1 cell wall hydrolase [Metabacillus arenae]